MLRNLATSSTSAHTKESPPPPTRITTILRQQMNPQSRSAALYTKRKSPIKYHPCSLISEPESYNPRFIQVQIPSSMPSQQQKMKMKPGRGEVQGTREGERTGRVSRDEARSRGLARQDKVLCEEEVQEEEEDKLRSKVRSVKMRGNLNLQNIGSILQGSEGFYKRKNGKPTPITLSVEQVEEYECAFKQFDINGDGVITTVELRSMLQSIGLNPSDKEIQEMIAEVDCNGDGIIDFCEFLKMMSRHSNPGVDPEQQLAEVFRLFDKDRSGYITQDELRSVMLSLGQPLSDEQLRDMIGYADLDGDGKINLKEFIKIMTTDTKGR